MTIKWSPENITSTVQVSISFRNLEDRDTFSKSDPICMIYHRPPGSNDWVTLLHTEMIENDLNPDFATKLIYDYKFEKTQALRFHVYDVDDDCLDFDTHESLGYVDVTLGDVVMAGPEGYTKELSGLSYKDYDNYKPPSTILLIAEELTAEKEEIHLKLGANAIAKWSGPLPPKTYFMISKLSSADKFLVVHRSAMVRGTNPVWPPLKMSSQTLCNGDPDKELKIDVFQLLFSGALLPIGSTLTTLNKMLSLKPKTNIPLTGPKEQELPASIYINLCTLTPIHTFIDYVRVTQIHVWFSIDFTCSNGDPHDARSLHYYGPTTGNDAGTQQPNFYEQAIRAVGNVLQDYSSTDVYKCRGFGARLPPVGDLSYDFCLNLTDCADCPGIDGVLEAYRFCLPQLQLYGPTYFAPILKLVIQEATKSKPGENYYILVILTDGVITDLEETKRLLVDSSGLPLSIVIIGLGEADFSAMEELDGDAMRISYKKKYSKPKYAQRDIVQFVPYRSARLWMCSTGETTDQTGPKKEGNSESGTPITPKETPAAVEARRRRQLKQSPLAQEVLTEIPRQLVSYMRLKGIVPSMITPSEEALNPKSDGRQRWKKVAIATQFMGTKSSK